MKKSKRGLVVFTIVLSIFLVVCANVSAADKMHFYRFWDTTPGKNQHFYTSDKAEKANVNQYPLFIYEGIIGYTYSTSEDGRVPLYRLYNSTNGNYIYTADGTERNSLVSSGWTYERMEGYVYNSSLPQPSGTVPLYHFYHTVEPDNFYTTYEDEKNTILTGTPLTRPYPPWNQYEYKGIECYLGAYIFNSDKSQIILSLYSPTNSHVGLWDSTVYQTTLPAVCEGISVDCSTKTTPAECQAVALCPTPPCCKWYDARDVKKHPAYDIYYDEIFGYPYDPSVADPHVCTGDNKVLELFQDINSHAQKNEGSLPYVEKVCYGDLDCQTTKDPANCPAGYKTVVRLYQEENSHVSEAADTNYPYKICCKTNYIPTTNQIHWANMKGDLITEADIGDTVLMIYENKAGQSFSFNIKEADNLFDDDIDTVSTTFDYGSHLAAKWTITKEMYEKGGNEDPKETFYFIVKSGGTDVGKSGELNVSKISTGDTNSPPNAIITYPAFNPALPELRKFKVNENINFQENSWDVDDSLKITWEFGDGSTSISCTWPDEDCDQAHTYSGWGTKEVYLRAEEIGRNKKASNYTEVYIYDAGTNVFAVMQEPENLKVFNYAELPIRFNASKSYVSKCQTGACPASFTCYTNPVSDLYCYDLPKSNIGTNPGQYNLWFDWNFSSGDVKYGNWSSNYPDVVDFTKYFFNPQKYKAHLKVGYEEF